MNCKQASNNNVPRRTGIHEVIGILAGEGDVSADHKAGDPKADECHVSVSLAHDQLEVNSANCRAKQGSDVICKQQQRKKAALKS